MRASAKWSRKHVWASLGAVGRFNFTMHLDPLCTLQLLQCDQTGRPFGRANENIQRGHISESGYTISYTFIYTKVTTCCIYLNPYWWSKLLSWDKSIPVRLNRLKADAPKAALFGHEFDGFCSIHRPLEKKPPQTGKMYKNYLKLLNL